MNDNDLDALMCKCGHPATEHHLSFFPGGGMLAEECEFWGWNEHGGAEWLEEEQRWIPHCDKFKEAETK